MKATGKRTTSVLCGMALVMTGWAGATSAAAKPLDKGHFHDVFTEQFDCDGIPTQLDGDVSGNFLFNKRGPGLAYYNENVRGTVVYTNLDTGGTFTNVFTTHTKDLKITDNGDGTLTILVLATGGSRYYDQDGKLVLKNPGQIRYRITVDNNGTPDNPFDDEEIEGSFQLVKPSTGRNDTEGRDFCADLELFTT